MYKYLIVLFILLSLGWGKVSGQSYFGKRVLVSYNLLVNNLPTGYGITHFFTTSTAFRSIHSFELEYIWDENVAIGINRYSYSSTYDTYTVSYTQSNSLIITNDDDPMQLSGIGYGVFIKGYTGGNPPFGFFGKFQMGHLRSKAVRLDEQGEIARNGDLDIRASIGHQAHIFPNLFLVIALDGALTTDFSGDFTSPPPMTNLERDLSVANQIQHAVNLRFGLIVPIF